MQREPLEIRKDAELREAVSLKLKTQTGGKSERLAGSKDHSNCDMGVGAGGTLWSKYLE